MLGLNTLTPSVFFNGEKVPGVLSINVVNNQEVSQVVLKVQEDPLITGLQQAGVTIRR
jgi:hypothetical protein